MPSARPRSPWTPTASKKMSTVSRSSGFCRRSQPSMVVGHFATRMHLVQLTAITAPMQMGRPARRECGRILRVVALVAESDGGRRPVPQQIACGDHPDDGTAGVPHAQMSEAEPLYPAYRAVDECILGHGLQRLAGDRLERCG